MKALHTISALLAAGLLLNSCELKEELSDSSSASEVGYISLGLSVSENTNSISRASSSVDIDDFIVTITNDETSVVEYTDTYANMEAAGSIELPVASYTIQANSNLTLEDVMTEPYYLGTTTVTIEDGETVSASLTGYMYNTMIALVLDDTFTEEMSSWDITITDGSNILPYSSSDSDATNPTTYYILVPDAVSYITVTVTGTTTQGVSVAETQQIAKDALGTYWVANDALTITIAIGESDNSDYATETTYSAVFSITADWTFADENDEYVTIEVDTTVVEDEDEEDDEDTTTDTSSNLPSITSDYIDGISFSVSAEDYPSSAVFVISAPLGFQTLLIDITSGNDMFAQGLALVSLDEEFDLLTLGSDYSEIFGTMPAAGDTEYSLDLGGFFSLMIPFGTTSSDGHQFKITVTDTEGNTATATIKIVLTD